MTMQILTMNAETKASVLAALNVYATSPGILVTIRKHDEQPATIAMMLEHWPADADGLFRIGLIFPHVTIVWRAWALAEIAAGRGLLRDFESYRDKLGIESMSTAYEYAAKLLKGSGCNGVNGDRNDWSKAAYWVLYDAEKPKPKWAPSVWRTRAKTHEAFAAVNLAMPGRPTWYPQATMLCMTPKEVVPPPTLAPADAEYLAALGAL
jgi:hypothetical protein